MTKIALVKPDHLGDLVLASPAIRAAQQHFGDVSLFVSDTTRPLAGFLFPEMELRSVNLPHLARNKEATFDLDSFVSVLNEFELILWLREDASIRLIAERVKAPQDFATGDHLTHDSAIHKRMMVRHVGNYSRTKLFSSVPIRWPVSISTVGLCVAAGFPTNRWPNVLWLELASRLLHAGLGLALIGGPAEREDVTLLARCLNNPSIATVIGGPDFRSFLDAIGDLDVVIATDGGSAHVCSLEKPVLSLFGSSPWRRYAPFGKENVVATRDLSCSPCRQFSVEEVNGCMTRECIIGLEPAVIQQALLAVDAVGSQTPHLVIQRGTSHTYDN